jgi:multiple sugar transport system permease protein
VAKAAPTWQAREQRVLGLFLAPALVTLLLVTTMPLLFLFGVSLTPWNLAKPGSFRLDGLTNYAALVRDGRFWHSIVVQAKLSAMTVSVQLLVGLGIALLLNARLAFEELARALFIIPMVLPPIVVAIMWKVLFTPDISLLDWFLGLLGLPEIAWLAHPRLALPAIIIADVWEWFPFTMLMLLAALQMMPDEPLEAARIDGASSWQVFWQIVLPLLRPAIVVTALFRVIESVKAFPLIFVMTGGGPGTVTEATNYYAFLQGFNYSMIGFSASISVVVLASTLLVSYLIIRLVGTHVEVE